MEILELAYSVSYSQLITQKEDLKNYRNQASFGAAIAGIVASVFAGFLSENNLTSMRADIWFLFFSPALWLVLITFVGSLVCSVLVVTAWKDVTFDLNAEWIIDRKDKGDDQEIILRGLIQEAETSFEKNEEVLDAVKVLLRMCLILGVAQIPAWLLLIFDQ